ncbi:MAG: hypothetical protein K9H49_01865 [Bacteroidales bacterium]|nr:hypothetical protein [Bacteroidales bacterium]MCF8404671.1 hypothetical protein [Bacteroidales bacterium]
MESGIYNFLKQFSFEKNRTARNKLKVFLVCLLISIVIWFLIVLSKQSSTTLEYQVIFKNYPSDLVLVNNPDSILSFKIATAGFELLTLKYLTRKKPIIVDLAGLNYSRDGVYYTVSYSTAQLSASVLNHMNFSEELVSISPESILFRFEKLTGKKVPVKPNLELSFAQQYKLADSIQLFPDSILVSGPKHLIESIQYVETVRTQVSNIKDKVKTEAVLKNPLSDGTIKLGQSKVEVLIKSTKFTEFSLNLKINAIPLGLKVKTFPEEVRVTYFVSLEDFKRIDPAMFKATINVSEATTNNIQQVKISEYPSFVEITRIEPSEVEYLVLKQ